MTYSISSFLVLAASGNKGCKSVTLWVAQNVMLSHILNEAFMQDFKSQTQNLMKITWKLQLAFHKHNFLSEKEVCARSLFFIVKLQYQLQQKYLRSTSTIKTLEKGVKYVSSQLQRQYYNTMVSLLLTLKMLLIF